MYKSLISLLIIIEFNEKNVIHHRLTLRKEMIV